MKQEPQDSPTGVQTIGTSLRVQSSSGNEKKDQKSSTNDTECVESLYEMSEAAWDCFYEATIIG